MSSIWIFLKHNDFLNHIGYNGRYSSLTVDYSSFLNDRINKNESSNDQYLKVEICFWLKHELKDFWL